MNAGRNYNGPMVEEFLTLKRELAAIVKLGYLLETLEYPTVLRYNMTIVIWLLYLVKISLVQTISRQEK